MKKLKSYVVNGACLILGAQECRYNRAVSTESNKVLLFITDLPDQLKSVITFLKKRNYEVYTVAELKDSVTKIFEIQPQFVFLAWDHNDRKVITFANLLAQTTSVPIIPFINKNTKDSILRFGLCPLNPKLYPPLSGPAVERLILKTGIDDRKLVRDRVRHAATAEEVRKAKQLLVDSLNQDLNEPAEIFPDQTNLLNDENNVQITTAPTVSAEVASAQINSHNALLNQSKNELQQNQISGFKQNLDDFLIMPLENILANQDVSRAFTGSALTPKSSLIIQKGAPSSFKNSTHLNHQDTGESKAVLGDGELTAPPVFIYCLSLVSEKWCGYFMVSTTTLLDYSQIDLAFSDWIKMQMDVGDLTESQYFELHNIEPEEWSQIKKNADYAESMQIQEHSFELCFLRISPEDMKVNLSEDGNYVRIPTEHIPTETPLDFGLWLHLPENRKYLLYTPQYSQFEEKQKQRLLTNKVDTLYTSLQHEKFYRYYLLKKNIQHLTAIRPKKAAAL